MSNCNELKNKIAGGAYDKQLEALYGKNAVAQQKERYLKAVESFEEIFGSKEEVFLFSAPGRTEIGGNHTDHNHGKVVAGSLNLDVIAVVAKTDDGFIKVKSEGYDMDTVETDNLTPVQAEINKSNSLIRGTAAGFVKDGYKIGSFVAYTTSNVLKGSGMSSSAAFEVLIGTILSHLYNNGEVSAVRIAQLAQYAENVFFGKPCGLMDQMASSVGGIITIDFADTDNPVIKKLDFDFKNADTALCIIDVGGDHADLTHEYAAIPSEMLAVAEFLGYKFLSETTYDEVFSKLPAIREELGDRAALRALHFLAENDRVDGMVNALNSNDFETFKEYIISSGHSSYEYLQNVFCCSNVTNQPMSLALCLADNLLKGKGAWRVHGGGFGGTIQAFVPNDMVDDFKAKMEAVFGAGSCNILLIRNYGGVMVKEEM